MFADCYELTVPVRAISQQRNVLFMTDIRGVQSEVVLIQPEAETGRPAGSLRLTCKTSGFNLGSSYMHWVRQVPGKGLEWLLYYYTSYDKNYAPSIMGRFTASKETSSNIFALNMKNLKIEDTAIYYCTRAVGSWIVTAIMIDTKTFQPLLFETGQ
ncbi:hypothetical protein chiPu_0018910 [Chiloscyllium punctatum]|uniref:Ig-like domain-containing protein n=1 Tax=Chiloscyllium punctatum TaxID=137246 RepID=A0A401RQA7_CHIPU|nr:hypothetical protein [Chiloscyllium punctatum]